MHLRNATLAAALAAVLGLAPQAGQAQGSDESPLKWYGSIYAKFLDGNRRTEQGLYSNSETTPGEGGGDQGQGIEFELLFNAQVSKQVEIGGRLHSRFNKNYWSNYGGFGVPDRAPNGGCEEDDPRCNQYVKLRGAWARINPGYSWMDSATIGNQDWGMFDAWTQGKIRYIDRDNLGGFLLQGSALDKTLRWDLARITIPNYQNLMFAADISSDDLYANDANWVAQLKYAPGPDWNATLIASYARDDEVDDDDPNVQNGVGTWKQFDNTVIGLKAQYTGLGFVDLSGSVYYSDLDVDESICPGTLNDDCRFQPLLKRSTDDIAFLLNANFNELFVDGLSLSVQYFDIGSDYVSLMAARRESDVLLTEGQEGTWQWGRPDYNTGNRSNANSMAGLGWGGWTGEMQQVVSLAADNDFTDFDEPVAYSVIGWKGFTLVPKYRVGDWEFAGEYSLIGFNTDWQACGGSDKDVDCATYIRQDGVHAWGVGGDYRSPYAPYQDREMQIFALKAMYTLDVGNGVDLMARYKYISDEDDRVTKSTLLADAYDGFPGSPVNPDWVPNVALGGCTGCDDREADYDTYGLSAGYQLTPDLYATLTYEFHQIELIDGTVDVAPVGMGFEASNDFGYAEYMTGEHEKNRIGLDFTYFLSGVEFGGAIDYLWGTYDPSFYTDSNGRRVKLAPQPGVTSIATPLGNIPLETVDFGQYRMKVFMKVKF